MKIQNDWKKFHFKVLMALNNLVNFVGSILSNMQFWPLKNSPKLPFLLSKIGRYKIFTDFGGPDSQKMKFWPHNIFQISTFCKFEGLKFTKTQFFALQNYPKLEFGTYFINGNFWILLEQCGLWETMLWSMDNGNSLGHSLLIQEHD